MRPLELDCSHFKMPIPEDLKDKYPDLPFTSDLNNNCMVSMWLPTDDEVANIIKGGVVVIRVAGNQPLPMAVTAGLLSETEQKAIDELREKEWTDANGEFSEAETD